MPNCHYKLNPDYVRLLINNFIDAPTAITLAPLSLTIPDLKVSHLMGLINGSLSFTVDDEAHISVFDTPPTNP